jgi:hypothetical protein
MTRNVRERSLRWLDIDSSPRRELTQSLTSSMATMRKDHRADGQVQGDVERIDTHGVIRKVGRADGPKIPRAK